MSCLKCGQSPIADGGIGCICAQCPKCMGGYGEVCWMCRPLPASDLAPELARLRAQVVALEADVHQRDARIAELEAAAAKASRRGVGEDGSVGFDCEHEGRRVLVTMARDGDTEIVISPPKIDVVQRIVARLRKGGRVWAASLIEAEFGEEAKR